MSQCIKGTCQLMCPEKEIWMREKEGLLHRFEIDERTKDKKRPKVDPTKAVKCFSRSAAGQVLTDPNNLRPAPVLMFTVKYLFNKIVTRADVDWVLVYDFVFDRLRSVRQDIVIQRIGCPIRIQIFELVVRFLVYASHRLCQRNISEFDPKINSDHLLECIKHLLVLYDEQDTTDSTDLNKMLENLNLENNRSQMEALYLLLYIGDTEALSRALNLPLSLRKSTEVQLAMKISLSWYLKNYVRACSLIQKLSPILICAVMANLQILRRNALKIMSSGYNSKTLTFPGLKLQELLLYKAIAKVQADCESCGLTFINQNILFQKANFKDNTTLTVPEMYYSSKAMHEFLPHILFNSL